MSNLRFIFVLFLGFSTQSFAAGCIGLPKAEKDACLQRIIAGNPPLTPTQRLWEEQQREASIQSHQRTKDYLRGIDARRAQEAALRQQQYRAEQEQKRQQQAAYEQYRRDAVAEATLQEIQRNNQIQQQAIEQAQQQNQRPRGMTCFRNGDFLNCH